MEVTRANFRDLLPELTTAINNSSFVCLDGEFTGLNSGNDVTSFDTPSQYYNKLREGAMSFLFFQFGLAVFQFDEAKQRYTHSAYNFYLFPRPHNRHAKDIRFMCQSSCIDFLASQGFDFNKVFREGIPYLCDPDEQEVREQLEIKRKLFNTPKDAIRIPDDLKSCVENACQQIQQFLESNKDEQDIILERPNGFARRLVYQEAKERFSKDQVALETRNFVLVARRINGSEQRLKEEVEKREQEEAEIDEAIGFTHIIRLLSQSGKLIVGHNLLLDLLHIIRQFYVPLPDSYEEFKELLHSLFPKLLDTKYMCSSPPFKDILSTSALVNLIPALQNPPFALPDVDCVDGKGYKSIDLKYHEAGFDAYMTGLIFLSLGNFLVKTRVFAEKENQSVVESPLLKPYINRLYLMRIQDTHIYLGGADPNPDRDHVYYLTFPKDWRYNEINQMFASFGSIFISWINDTSAWVALQHKEQTVNVKNTLLKNTNHSDVTITHYNDYITKIESEPSVTVSMPSHQLISTPVGNRFYSSPATSAARKRQPNVNSNDVNSIKRSKRESLSKKSLSGIIPDTIPEEAEESPLKKKKIRQDSCTRTCVEELQNSMVSPKKKKLEFEENDAWE